MNKYIVLEYVKGQPEFDGAEYVIRAAQSTLKGALQYCNTNRFIVTVKTYDALYKKVTY